MKKLLFSLLLGCQSYAMIPQSIEDVDLELCYMEMILSNLETSLDQFHQIKDYKKGMEQFKYLCVQYKTMNNHPVWITDIFNEPDSEQELEEQEPPSDNEDNV